MGVKTFVKFHGQSLPLAVIVENRRSVNSHKRGACFRSALRHGQADAAMTKGFSTHSKIKERICARFYTKIFQFLREEIGMEAIVIGHRLFVQIFIGLADGQCPLLNGKFQRHPKPEGILRQRNCNNCRDSRFTRPLRPKRPRIRAERAHRAHCFAVPQKMRHPEHRACWDRSAPEYCGNPGGHPAHAWNTGCRILPDSQPGTD